MNAGVVYALLAATLFGASTPIAKALLGSLHPVMMGGLLYLGSGLGLCLARLVRDRGWSSSGLTAQEWPWLLGAIFFGGVLGPVALMFGLRLTSGSTASLMLNLEAVLTALIAWLAFRESAGGRVVLGMGLIVAGGLVLSWPSGGDGVSQAPGLLAIAVACLCWAIDNNLTRKVSASDALFIAGIKGLIAGLSNTALALAFGLTLPALPVLLGTLVLGLAGYGLSLVCFVLALRGLGTARTGAYFSSAPFMGALVAIAAFGETPGPLFWGASLLMAAGVFLHLSEHHVHRHTHEAMHHRHMHRHDEHHQHGHPEPVRADEVHEHEHSHESLSHEHAHFPDIHHRHLH